LMSTSCPTSYDVTAPAGPLTTVFTPPYPCESYDCMPPGFTDYWLTNVGYYSPAICPLSYTVDCSRPSDLCNGVEGPTQTQGEFAWRCCPSSYSCGESGSYCTSFNTAMNTNTSTWGLQIRWKPSDLSILETDP
ncbi:hypothetical protein BU16DRAFT_441975, partial [Lophium mytilinum]